ncbi:MAG: hypothetical protein F6K30_12225 [Cyanothece sp. SIO2G6]|nr:hypothetical protein [Cyanothece sp. SIO2G6]
MERGFANETRDPELPFQLMRNKSMRHGSMQNGSMQNGSMQNGYSERSPSSQSIPQVTSLPLITPPATVQAAPQPGFKLQRSNRSANRAQPNPMLPQPPTLRPIPISASPPSGMNKLTGMPGTGAHRTVTWQSEAKSIAISPPSVQAQPITNPVDVKVVPVTAQSTPLPTPTEQTAWVQTLIWVHRSIGVATVALVLTALGLYGQSVYYQQQWGQSYRRLQRLKTSEYQGIAANEIMKHTLLEQAATPGIAMRMPLPGTAISIQKVPPRALQIVEQPVPIQDVEMDAPTGY